VIWKREPHDDPYERRMLHRWRYNKGDREAERWYCTQYLQPFAEPARSERAKDAHCPQ